MRKPRVLIVDDNDQMRDVFAWCMRAAGWVVEDVANGVDALAIAVTFEPDVIVMDLHLPFIDGLTATRRMKRDPRLADVPIVACSAFVEQHVADMMDAGFAAVVPKPCTAEELRDRLERLVAEVRATEG